MKIALLSEKYTPDIGGLAISTERFARLLTSAGHTVRVFCPTFNLPPSEQRTLFSNGIHLTRFGAHKRTDDTLVDWFELIVAEHRRQPHEPFDLLHAYFLTQAGFVAAYTGNYLNLPSVVSIRGNDIERAAFDPSRFSHTMFALQNASAVTTNASELAKKARAFIARDIHLIPNGVDSGHFKPMERNAALAEALGLEGNRNVVGFVGELREKKGLATLLSTHAQVNKVQPTSLLIVGEVRQGEDKQLFEELRSSNPQVPITVTGYITPKELPAYYALMDVFVHPSLRDGMPNAVLEAMACGTAVVATDVGGVSDVIQAGVNGTTVPANDAESLSNAIMRLLKDGSMRSQLGKQARETVEQKFTLEKELLANMAVYQQVGLL
jgi:glycosyltransferase involved in cell wall biosynthesis